MSYHSRTLAPLDYDEADGTAPISIADLDGEAEIQYYISLKALEERNMLPPCTRPKSSAASVVSLKEYDRSYR